MLAKEQLKDLLNKKGFSSTDKLLLCLATDNSSPKQVKEIKEVAKVSGLREAAKWNVSSLLSRTKGKAILAESGWELTSDGRDYVGDLVGPLVSTPVLNVASSLRIHLSKIQNDEVKSFIEEGIECFERGLYRSAVVLTWSGAISLLQHHVINVRLTEFNTEALRRDAKWRVAKTADDLGRMKEHDFLQVCESLSVIGKNVKQELEKQLKLRNACGHPNSLAISANVTAAHVEILMLNVFAKF